MDILKTLEITKGTIINKINLNKKIKAFKIDSRKISKGDCFITIGNSYNYINQAINNGASLIIAGKNIFCNVPVIVVQNTTKTLGLLAKYIREKYNPKVIAITGSNGKTTTRDILYNILKRKYNVITNEKNYNNHIGVPLTIFNIQKNTEIAVVEMGMNHLGEISYLSKMINPDIGIITNIGTAHIGNLGSIENILKAKLEITDGLKGKLFVNGDDNLLKYLNLNISKSGFNTNNDLKAYNLKTNLEKSSFNIKVNNKQYLIETNLPKHLLPDVLLAINVSLHLKIDIKDIIKALKEYKPFTNRMNIIKKNSNIIINDCYNSSLESLMGILNVLKNEKKHKILILGDIKEAGKYSEIIHEKIKDSFNNINNKEIILAGKHMKKIKNTICFNNYQEIINHLKNKKIENSIILIKASRIMHFENITNFLLKAF